ncbi:MAG: ROK family protein [Candidatus Electryonea clarkiae]|nr:ROK family protein [Candidatus Electryonea clarkiae]MDP8288783.1 ROK family protein [Candidatus Electryonea clarkiae]
MPNYVIGVDLGGTKVEACLMDSDRNIHTRNRAPSEPSLGLDQVIDNITKVIETAASGQEFSAIGMGTPGTYIPSEDKLYGSPHTPIYETPGFIGLLRSRLDVPLVIENDANCLALAEYYAVCLGKYSHIMAVIIGTGMGYGLILNDKLYRGARGGAGEIGHTSIDLNGRLCECGRHGCAEAYLSGSSIRKRYRELGGKDLEAAEIYKLYQVCDQPAMKIFEESCMIMGELFANIINALDLQAIILGGGVSNIPLWYEKVPQYLERSIFGPPRDKIPILKAKLGDSSGVAGAAYLALREIGALEF